MPFACEVGERFETALQAAKAAAKHFKVPLKSLVKKNKGSTAASGPSVRGVTFHSRDKKYELREPGGGTQSFECRNMAMAAALSARPNVDIRASRKQWDGKRRLQAVCLVYDSILPGDLEDLVGRFAASKVVFHGCFGALLLEAMMKYKPARDLFRFAFAAQGQGGSVERIYEALLAVARGMDGRRLPIWQQNCGRCRQSGWLPLLGRLGVVAAATPQPSPEPSQQPSQEPSQESSQETVRLGELQRTYCLKPLTSELRTTLESIVVAGTSAQVILDNPPCTCTEWVEAVGALGPVLGQTRLVGGEAPQRISASSG